MPRRSPTSPVVERLTGRRRLARRDRASGDGLEVVPVRHPGRWVVVAFLCVLVAMLVHTLFFSHVYTNGIRRPRFDWSTIDHFFGSSQVLQALVVTIELTVLAMAGGIVLGIIVAIMRLSPNPIVSNCAWVYIWFFRGTPVLVQLLFWFNINVIFPKVSLGIPFGPSLFSVDMQTAMTPFLAATVGLVLNEGAYMSEIVRAGIVSVDPGQIEAAQSLGMRRLAAMRLVVLPQAMRVILPPTGNETISMLKTTSIASVVSLFELTYTAENIAAANYKPIPLYITVSLWYLMITSIMMVGQYYLERHYARGSVRQLPPTPLQRLRRGLLIRPDGRGGFGRFPGVIGVEGAPVMLPEDDR
ncbi:MAG TPA: amino acid ABC transporter permease [Acidimicrobiales bacterium]|nr:amino acid ABC transporter permease [Acidimicrobiales bacterium]